MAQLFYGSICLTDMIEKAKAKHSSFSKSEKNGKIYVNISVWLNDSPDKYNNVMALQLSSTKDMKEKEDKFYIGNCKKSDYTGYAPINDNDVSDLDVDITSGPKPIVDEKDDLPF